MEIAELKQKIENLEKKIRDLEVDLIHDPMSGLKTRVYFEEEVRRYLSIMSNTTAPTRRESFGFHNLSVVFFDIDHFKKVNDKYGHDAGDRAIRKVAEVITESIRTGDTAARWGGEEIIVSLLGANEEDAKNKAEDIRKKIEELSFVFDKDFRLTISAGVANAKRGIPYEEMFRRVDKSLYNAKETGRNKVVAYSELNE